MAEKWEDCHRIRNEEEIKKLRTQRDYLVEFVKECEGYVLTSYYQQRVGPILAEIEAESND